ncbi:MAG TPA: hypothetical protein VGT04_08540 [Acidobacteriaceae bacterium]|nr:hypothetical protein [Acidobacteriaceae bacterium]
MADVKINVPPPAGSLSLAVGDQLTIHAAQACSFCCSIGDNFTPSIASIQLAHGDNGPYTADSVGSGQYNTADANSPCNPNAPRPMLNAQSIQIHN